MFADDIPVAGAPISFNIMPPFSLDGHDAINICKMIKTKKKFSLSFIGDVFFHEDLSFDEDVSMESVDFDTPSSPTPTSSPSSTSASTSTTYPSPTPTNTYPSTTPPSVDAPPITTYLSTTPPSGDAPPTTTYTPTFFSDLLHLLQVGPLLFHRALENRIKRVVAAPRPPDDAAVA